MNKKIFFAVMISGIVAAVAGILFHRTYISIGHVPITGIHRIVSDTHAPRIKQNIHFEIATTTIEQERGLSGRSVIPNNYAMLFVFSKLSRYGFWMKDMLVPIDIVWLSDNRKIVDIRESVQPNTYPQIFYPPAPVKYVLEVRSGFSSIRGWHVGSTVVLPPPYDKNFSK